MDMSNTIWVIVFLAMIIVPVWALVKAGGKQKRIMLRKFRELESQYKVTITQTDIWDNIAIGLNPTDREILWLRALENNDQHLFISLDNIAQCKKVNTTRGAGVADVVGLELVSKNPTVQPVLLEFYNAKNSYVYTAHLELQGKWHKLITENLRA